MSSSPTDQLVDVTMPQMGVSVAEGTIIAWSKQVGEAVSVDETVCEISTDKIDSEVPAPAAGVIREILAEPGATVPVGSVIARLATADEQSASDAPRPSPPGADTAHPSSGNGTARSAVMAPRFCSPVARRIAAEHEIELETVTPTGRNGRVTKADVLSAVAARAGEADPPVASTETQPTMSDGAIQLTGMRRAIARHMRTSLDTAAHVTTVVEVDVTALERRRRELGVTALPLIARHTIEALREFPALNAWIRDETVVEHRRVHLGIAVSLGDEGLIVPVIHDAQELSVEGLANRIKQLAANARSGRLEHDDVDGATFTLTNPGAYGALIATPIINQPQVAILDTEAVVRRPVVITSADGEESIAIRSMMHLCMSWDHRAVDGAYAARFLAALGERIERR